MHCLLANYLLLLSLPLFHWCVCGGGAAYHHMSACMQAEAKGDVLCLLFPFRVCLLGGKLVFL